MKASDYADIVRKNDKMFNLFFEAYVIAQLKECCENQSDRWGISAQDHKEFVEDYCGWFSDNHSDADDYYRESLDIIEIVLRDTDYEEEDNPYESGTVWEILAGECWDILNTHHWWMDYYEEWAAEKEDE